VALVALVALGTGVVLGRSNGDGERGRSESRDEAAARAPGAGIPSRRSAPTPLERARQAAARMPLERQLGELLVIAFSGTTAPGYVVDALREGRAAGVILFGANAPSAGAVRQIAAAVQRAAGGDAIVCLDQEGGEIRTLRFAPPDQGQARQATPAAARASAARTARALRAVGVDVTLGPVADVATTTDGSVMAGRAFPGDAKAVAASVAAAAAAYREAGVAPTLKHFPGLGATTANTDFASAAIRRTRAQLLAEDLLPYRDVLRSAAADRSDQPGPPPLVMLDHARYPAIDPDRIASQSPAIATGLLRETLGFDGVAMTDSLEARAVDDATPGDADVGAAAVRSLEAGADLLLLTGAGSFRVVRRALLAHARRSPALRRRVAESAARVLALRAELPR
jgi:beta-N-acetylhexosaminidase